MIKTKSQDQSDFHECAIKMIMEIACSCSKQQTKQTNKQTNKQTKKGGVGGEHTKSNPEGKKIQNNITTFNKTKLKGYT